VLRGLGAPGAEALSVVFTAWDDIVGPRIAAHARPTTIDGDCLVVAVDEPGWATELRFLQADLIRRLEVAAGGPVVTRIEPRVRPPHSG
jgi:predicted nucleic acid-binding Zn ribbon protein